MEPQQTKTLIQSVDNFPSTFLGYHTSKLGVEENLDIPDERRFTHVLSLGQTGTGKTQQMVHAAIQDAQKGHGFCMIIPKGRSIDQLIAKLPDDRLDDVIYINPGRDPVTPINVLEPHLDEEMTDSQITTQKELIVSNTVDLFKRQSNNWGDQFGHLFETLLRAHLDLNMYHDEQNSLLDVYRCVVSDDALVDLIDRTNDPIIREELTTIHEDISSYELKPLQHRLNDFVMNGTVRKVIAAEKSGIDFREAVNNGKIILVDVRAGELGNTVTTMIGSIVVTKVWAAAQSRIALPEDQRTPFFLYVDEVHRFGGEGSAFTSILSTAREYRLGCWMVTQYLGQLEKEMREAVTSNCRTKIVFDPSGSEDVSLIASLLQGVSKEQLTQLGDYRAVVQKREVQQATKAVFVDTYPPWEADYGTVETVKEQATVATKTQADTMISQSLGRDASAGGERHGELLAAAKQHLENEDGVQVNLLYQESGEEKPDGHILYPDGSTAYLEAEASTLSRPVKVLRNAFRAAMDDTPLIVVVEEGQATKLRNIIEDPVNRRGDTHEDDQGTFSYYRDEEGGPLTELEQLQGLEYEVLEVDEDEVGAASEVVECPELDTSDRSDLEAFCLYRGEDGFCEALGQPCVLTEDQ